MFFGQGLDEWGASFLQLLQCCDMACHTNQVWTEWYDYRLQLVWCISFTNPLRKARLESGAGLRQFPLQILWEKLAWRLDLVWATFLYKSFEKSSPGVWSWFEAVCFAYPLRKACLETEAGLMNASASQDTFSWQSQLKATLQASKPSFELTVSAKTYIYSFQNQVLADSFS